jgi:hypothetical protein
MEKRSATRDPGGVAAVAATGNSGRPTHQRRIPPIRERRAERGERPHHVAGDMRTAAEPRLRDSTAVHD